MKCRAWIDLSDVDCSLPDGCPVDLYVAEADAAPDGPTAVTIKFDLIPGPDDVTDNDDLYIAERILDHAQSRRRLSSIRLERKGMIPLLLETCRFELVNVDPVSRECVMVVRPMFQVADPRVRKR